MLMDTHCHIFPTFFKQDAERIAESSLNKEVFLNLVGTQYETSVEAVVVAEKFDNAYASVGLHPTHVFPEYFGSHEVEDRTHETDFDYEKYKKLALGSKKVVAIGECGLDTYRLPESANRSKVIEKQTAVFLKHADLARELSLPLVIHVRAAHEEMIEVLKREAALGKPLRGVIHCYDSNWHYAEQFLQLGFYIGFTGIITFPPQKNNPKLAEDRHEVLAKCPLQRIVLETDSPFLAPVPYRGKTAEPWMVEEVAKKIAEIKGLGLALVREQTFKNSKALFSLE
jgi:TatD DNase family protein